MTKIEVSGLFALVGIEVLNMYELTNQYWPKTEGYYKTIMESPWWLVKTPFGLITIGWRKRVIEIDWSDTKVRKIITGDDVTKEENYVHAWSLPKALEYLTELSNQMKLLGSPPLTIG